MSASQNLEQIAKLAELGESVIELIREYGFLVPPRPRGGVKRKAANGLDADAPKRRRGRPKGSKNKTPVPPPPADVTDVDAEEEEEI